MFSIEEELKKLPAKPGVYIMHGEKDEIIYIGKAISLKNRVRQYFQKSRKRGAKIEKMVTHITRFEYIITDSELEALVLECNLIKEHRPKYNTMLTDDKTYPYIKVTLGEEYPRLVFSREIKKDKSRYFGPYASSDSVRETIELLGKLYKIRTCNRVLPRDIGKQRECLNYHIKRCEAPCQGRISAEEYRAGVDKAVSFLAGNYAPVLEYVKQLMEKYAEELEFEMAAQYREILRHLQSVAQKQKMSATDGEDKDIIALAADETDAVISVFFMRDGRLIGREHFFMKTPPGESRKTIINDFVKQYYSGTPFIPAQIMLQREIEDAALLEEWLSTKRKGAVHIRVPKKGSKEKLVELAIKNAKMVLAQDKERIRREEGRTIGALKEIRDILGLSKLERVEAYDISNTNGFESVGSMVVFEKGKPAKSDYRKFRIKTVVGPDDYGSMREVLTRRFERGNEELKLMAETGYDARMGRFSKFPDLIMMDGGKGQVHAALEILEKIGVDIPVCGMVKDDRHRTRGLVFEEKELPIDTSSEGFKLITRIQDEAHRFAIEYHRSLRSSKQVHSQLDDIPGIGPARRRALMKNFESIEEIRGADIETLSKIEGMNNPAAEAVYNFFHRKQEESD